MMPRFQIEFELKERLGNWNQQEWADVWCNSKWSASDTSFNVSAEGDADADADFNIKWKKNI